MRCFGSRAAVGTSPIGNKNVEGHARRSLSRERCEHPCRAKGAFANLHGGMQSYWGRSLRIATKGLLPPAAEVSRRREENVRSKRRRRDRSNQIPHRKRSEMSKTEHQPFSRPRKAEVWPRKATSDGQRMQMRNTADGRALW